MAVIFDPLTGQLINVPTSSGGGGQVTPEVRPISFVSGEGAVIPDNADVVWVDINVPDYSILLPANPQENQILKIVGVGGGTFKVTINANSGQGIDGALPLIEFQKGLVLQYSAGNWYTILVGDTPSITGTPDAVAFFNDLGVLSSSSNFKYINGSSSLAYGSEADGAIIATNFGSFASGQTSDSGSIFSNGIGSIATGRVQGLDSSINAGFEGSIATGVVRDGGTLLSNDSGARAHGQVTGNGILNSATIDAQNFGSEGSGSAVSSLVVGSLISASGNGAKALGSVIEGGKILTIASGAIATGLAENEGIIQAASDGSLARGNSSGVNSTISASDAGADAAGLASAGGAITARDRGARAAGRAIGDGTLESALIDSGYEGSEAAGRVNGDVTPGGSIVARGSGSKALGTVLQGGFIGQVGTDSIGAADGSIASGRVTDSGQIMGQNHGTYAVGRVLNGGGIYAPSVASFSHGFADGVGSSIGIFFDPGVLDPTGTNFAWGVATGGGKVYAYNTAATAWGLASGVGAEIKALGPQSTAFGSAAGIINSSGTASLAAGFADVGLEIIATGTAALAFGIGPLSAPNDGAQVFGTGNGSTANYEMVIGSYAEAPVDGLSRFRVGGGTGVGTEFTAFQIDVDGKSFQKGSEVHRIRLVSAVTTLSGRTDSAVVLDTNNTFTVTLPDIAELVDGQTIHIGSNGAGANTVTVAAFAGTTLAANVPTSVVAATEGFTLRYLNTVWYLVG